MNIKDIEKIIDILSQSDVNEFELTQDGTTIKLNRGKQIAAQPVVVTGEIPVASAFPAAATVSAASEAVAAKDNSHLVPVESPIVGTYYGKPSPDADPFVTVGSKVKKGQKLCIIEAMKLMNEIECPANGTIEEVCISDSEVVEFGEVLFRINPA